MVVRLRKTVRRSEGPQFSTGFTETVMTEGQQLAIMVS